MTIKAVLWDCDGVLIDSERIYTEVTNLVLAPFGLSMPWNVKAALMGRKERDATTYLVETLKVPISVDEYIEKQHALQHDKWPSVKVLPGAQELVEYLNAVKVPQAIATSSRTESFMMKTAHNQQLFSLIPPERVVRGDDPRVKVGKPAPDIFLAAARTVGIEPGQEKDVLVFEDSPEGVRAAKAAGMKVIWVPLPQIRQELAKSNTDLGADEVLESLLEFDPTKYGLPPLAAAAKTNGSATTS